MRLVAPVGTEVVLLGGICGPDGHYVMKQPIEWSLSNDSVGNFVDAGESCDLHTCSWLRNSPATKKNGGFAITRTSTESRMITRGTQSRDDDVLLKRGQSWVSVTSGAAGVSYVTAVAPGAENWDQRRQIASVVWVDAQWVLPGPAIAAAGQAHVLTTTVTRSSDNMPASNWIVRYEVAGGAPALFGPQGQTAVEVVTDANGQASAQLAPQSLQPGVTQVRVQVIAPTNGGDPTSRVVVGQGWTSVTWSAPGLAVRVSGPTSIAVDATANFRVEVSNPGDLVARGAIVSINIPGNLRFLNSNPAAEIFGPRVQWRLGDLGPKEARTLDVSCRGVREGDLRLCAQAQAQGNLSAEGCAAVRVAVASLAVRFVDAPATAKVGDQVTFNVEVTNTGTLRIGNVVARDTFQPGLVHTMGESSPIVRNLGNLEPNAVSRFSVSFLVRAPGRLCHTLDVSGEGGQTAVAQACVDVQQIALDVQVTLTGPTQIRTGEKAEYLARVTNTGQGPLTNARIAFYSEPTLLPELASPDYKYQEGGLIWELGTMKPGDTQSRTVKCGSVSPDNRAEARVVFNCQEAISRTAIAGTEIVPNAERTRTTTPAEPPPVTPAPATGELQVSIADTADPIPVGSATSYILTIKNDRAVSDRDVMVTFILPDGLQFRSFDSGGLGLTERTAPDGRTVAISAISELRPGETLRPLRLEVSAVKPGVLQLRVEVKSLRSAQPVVQDVQTTAQAR
jgi:uncharacterized repeat protein (TIGR01451 family)